MLKSKSILFFSITFILVYMALILPWGDLSKSYAVFYSKQAKIFFENIGKNGYIVFEQIDDANNDIKIRQTNKSIADDKGNVQSLVYSLSSKTLAYLPTALLIALFISTPVKLIKRFLYMLLGYFILHLFLMGSLYIILVHHYAHTTWLKMYQSKSGTTNFIDFLNGIVTNGTGLNSFIVIFIWIGLLLLFERKRLMQIRNASQTYKVSKTL